MTEVQVSENIYIAGLPIFYISRFLGLAPVSIKVSDRNYTIKFSWLFIVLSYLLGIIMISLTFYGLYEDSKAGIHSLRMGSTKTAIIAMFDILILVSIVSIGIFGGPFRLKSVMQYLIVIGEADAILLTSEASVAQRRSKILISAILVLTFAIIIYTIGVEDRIDDGYYAIKNYLAFYSLYFVVFMVECQYNHLVQGVERRFKKLNSCLMSDAILKVLPAESKNVFNVKVGFQKVLDNDKNFTLYFDEIVRRKMITAEDFPKVLDKTLNGLSSREYIQKMSEAHGKLCEAVDIINSGFGFLVLVIITSCLFHLVVSPYFLLLDLLGESSTTTVANLILQFLWVVTHVCRLLLIIQPCYLACEEAKNTNPLVSKMLCSDIDEFQKKQLQLFSLQLIHRQIEFSAYGLSTIDRPLLSAIAGAITTYLVILLQFR